jgi:hypothetical protein
MTRSSRRRRNSSQWHRQVRATERCDVGMALRFCKAPVSMTSATLPSGARNLRAFAAGLERILPPLCAILSAKALRSVTSMPNDECTGRFRPTAPPRHLRCRRSSTPDRSDRLSYAERYAGDCGRWMSVVAARRLHSVSSTSRRLGPVRISSQGCRVILRRSRLVFPGLRGRTMRLLRWRLGQPPGLMSPS